MGEKMKKQEKTSKNIEDNDKIIVEDAIEIDEDKTEDIPEGFFVNEIMSVINKYLEAKSDPKGLYFDLVTCADGIKKSMNE